VPIVRRRKNYSFVHCKTRRTVAVMADRLEQMRAKLAAHKRAHSETDRAVIPDEKPRSTLAQKKAAEASAALAANS